MPQRRIPVITLTIPFSFLRISISRYFFLSIILHLGRYYCVHTHFSLIIVVFLQPEINLLFMDPHSAAKCLRGFLRLNCRQKKTPRKGCSFGVHNEAPRFRYASSLNSRLRLPTKPVISRLFKKPNSTFVACMLHTDEIR